MLDGHIRYKLANHQQRGDHQGISTEETSWKDMETHASMTLNHFEPIITCFTKRVNYRQSNLTESRQLLQTRLVRQ